MKRVVPGIHSVLEALNMRARAIECLWIKEGELHGELEEILHTARGLRVPVKRFPLKTLDREVQSHQGVLAFVNGGPDWPHSNQFKSLESCLIFALDGLEDPHNVGSIMRSAWNLGASGVIMPRERSAGGAPSAQKVASGAFEHVPILEVPNLAAELISMKELGFWVYGLEASAPSSLLQTELAAKSILVIGSEESGMRKPVVSACDALISIPQAPGASSLNAAVAGAVVGFEFLRQRNLSQRLKNSTEKI